MDAAFVRLQPFHFGAAYLITPAVSRTAPLAFEIERRPLTVFGGYGLGNGRLRAEADLGVQLEWLERTAAASAPGSTASVQLSGADTRFIVSLGPRISGEVRLLPQLGLLASLGLDIVLNNFKYIQDGSPAVTLLRPERLRPVAMLGVALYP